MLRDEGIAINSGPFDGLSTAEFKTQDHRLAGGTQAAASGKINYKLRDWLFSRQRYWGEPFPILHELDAAGKPTGVIRPLTPADLPLRLPELDDYKPSGKPEPPLGKATDWLKVTLRRQTLPARDEHDAAVGRLVLVLPALHRSEQRPGSSAIRPS